MVDDGEQIACGITDTPYNHLERHRAIGTTTRLKNSWFPTLTMADITEVYRLYYDLLSESKHFYAWTNAIALEDMLRAIRDAGFTFLNLLIWDKMRIGMGYNYRGQCEFLIFCSKGKREKLRKNPSHIFRYHRPRDLPPYAKPWQIYRDVLECSTDKGDRVLDAFGGTDPLSVASAKLGLESVSIDVQFPVTIIPFTVEIP